MKSGVEAAAAGLDEFLNAELSRHDLPPERLALVGFSQGTMMSLQVGLRRKVKPAAIVGYSGMLTNTEGLEQHGREAPPIDGAGGPLANRTLGVLAANGFFLGPLLGGSLWLRYWFHGFTPSVRGRRKR